MADEVSCKSSSSVNDIRSVSNSCMDNVSSLVASTSEAGSVSDKERFNSLSCEEYEMQLFGFTAKTFADGLYNATVDYFSDHLDSAIGSLKSEVGVGLISDSDVQHATTNIYNSALPVIDTAIDKLESYMRTNVFNIPSYALLKEDGCHADYPCDVETVEALTKDIKDLEKKLIATKYLKIRLNEELEESQTVLKTLDQIIEGQKFNDSMLLSNKGLVDSTRQVAAALLKLSDDTRTDDMEIDLRISAMKRTTVSVSDDEANPIKRPK